jgi:hypothetical protein
MPDTDPHIHDPNSYFGDYIMSCVGRASVHDLLEGGGARIACTAVAIRDAICAQPECPMRAMDFGNRFMAYETDFESDESSRVEPRVALRRGDRAAARRPGPRRQCGY